MANVSKPAQEAAGLVGELLAIALGAWMILRAWDGFGWGLVIIGAVGFAVSAVRLWRAIRES